VREKKISHEEGPRKELMLEKNAESSIMQRGKKGYGKTQSNRGSEGPRQGGELREKKTLGQGKIRKARVARSADHRKQVEEGRGTASEGGGIKRKEKSAPKTEL